MIDHVIEIIITTTEKIITEIIDQDQDHEIGVEIVEEGTENIDLEEINHIVDQ